jgi:hypothetical protein
MSKSPRKKDLRKTKVIHVNQLVIRSNKKQGRDDPPLAIRTLSAVDKATYAHETDLYHNGVKVGSFVYRPGDPLSCGARVWFESDCLEIVPRERTTQES